MMDYEPPVSQLLTLGGPKILFGLGKGSDYAEFGFRAEHVAGTGQNDYRHGPECREIWLRRGVGTDACVAGARGDSAGCRN